jgi:hypothetical protein
VTDESPTVKLRIIAPGFAWLPRFLRDKLTPALVGSAITGLFMGLAYIINSPQKDIHHLQESITRLELSLGQVLDLSHKNETEQAGMKKTVEHIEKDLASQNEWRTSIEREAEAPPHARRRK